MSELTPQPSSTAGNISTAAGYGLVIQTGIVGFASVPLVLFAGFGLVGLLACAGLAWPAQILLSGAVKYARLAGVVVVLAGAASAAVVFLAAVLFSCRSFMNCGSSDLTLPLALPAAFVVLDLLCAVLLFRRSLARTPSAPQP
jgi:hypothetical protein